MTYTVKKTLAMLFLAVFGSALLYNCEPESDSLGEQLFIDGAAQGNEISYPLIAYNINNNDTIRSDAGRLLSLINTSNPSESASLAVLGVFSEGQFGTQKASFLTQLRMSADNFSFGTTPKVDSVVLVIKPQAVPDSLVTRPLKDESLLVGTETVPVSTEIKSYPTNYDFKYGKMKLGPGGTHTLMHIKVDEITTFLDANNPAFKSSNVVVNTGTALGSVVFDGRVTSKTVIKKSDNSTLFTSDVGIRIPLNKDFFQTKILDKNGKPELMDAANFTRYFKGIKLSVTDTDGYLLQFNPNNMEMVMYYTNEKNDNGTITRPQSTFKFLLTGNVGNARIGKYEYDRDNSAWEKARLAINEKEGNTKLYLQGMGGPSVGVKIPDATVAELKELYENKKAAIISAKIRIFTDAASWDNNYKKTKDNLTILPLTKDESTGLLSARDFTLDVIAGFKMLTSYDLNKNSSSYEFTVTKTVKDIVEGTAMNKLLLVNIGQFVYTAAGQPAGYRNTSTAFATERGVFVGTDKDNPNSIQLKIIYGTKK